MSHKTYHTPPLLRGMTLVFATFFLLLPIWLLVTRASIINGTIEGLFALFYIPSAFVIIYVYLCRLIISPNGIEYIDPPIRTCYAWNEIEAIVVNQMERTR